MGKLLFFIAVWCVPFQTLLGQDSTVLSFKEYLGYVKRYHPIAKQAELTLDIGQANLMRSRGGFDPRIEVDYERKKFKNTEYYDRLNTTFKIPTWYGVELKGKYEQNEGVFLNPAENVPADGLYSAGVSVSLGRGSWINERMATLRRAKFFRERSRADRDLLINQILYDAALSYFEWLRAYRETAIYRDFLRNAQIRFEGTRSRAVAGDIAAIDTVEAKIAMQNRALNLEQATLKLTNSSLELANFLWMGDNIPMELRPNVVPDIGSEADIDVTLEIMGKPLDSFLLENHPKLESLSYKIKGLEVDKSLKTNKLMPKMDLEYNFLTETPELIGSLAGGEYKGGIHFMFPLFLRKERGELKLAKFKLRDAQYEFDNAELQLRNKVLAIYNELESYRSQTQQIGAIVESYATLRAAEERKFSFGESSLFLINVRENKLIDAQLKEIHIQNKFFRTKAKLFNNLAVVPKNL